jgi:hypothetical protein
MKKCKQIKEGNNRDSRGHVKIDNVAHLSAVTKLTLSILAAVSISLGGWGISPALADARPPLDLTLSGSHSTPVKQPIDITVKLANPGAATADARLRIFIHDGNDRDLGLDTIEINVQEGDTWINVPFEAIDGGVMAALGATGKHHLERHERGGFAIDKQATKVWRLRVTFRLSGRYSLVVAVSPNNGATHLVQPKSMIIEAL